MLETRLVPAVLLGGVLAVPNTGANVSATIGHSLGGLIANATTTTVSTSANPSTLGQTVTFTATVGSSTAPTGSVEFVVDGALFGNPVGLNSSGRASINDAALSVGNHTVQALFVPTGNFVASAGSLGGGQTVIAPAVTTTVVGSSINPSTVGQTVTFTATVGNTMGSTVPTGSVQFEVDGAAFGNPVTLDRTGHASIGDASLTAGNHTVQALYLPTNAFAGSSGTLSGGQTTVAAIDLFASHLSLSAASQTAAQWNGPITFTFTVTNQGPVAAQAFGVNVYVANNPTINPSDTADDELVGNVSFGNGLAGNTSSNNSITRTVTLDLPKDLFEPGTYYLGLQVVPNAADASSENPANNINQGLGIDVAVFQIIGIVESEPNDTMDQANPIGLGSLNNGAIGTPGDGDFYTFTLPENGTATLSATALPGSNLDSRLALFAGPSPFVLDGQPVLLGGLLTGTDDPASGQPNPILTQWLPAGTYWVEVAASTSAGEEDNTGAYQLSLQFAPNTTNPAVTSELHAYQVTVGNNPQALVTADFNNDGIPDLAVLNQADNTVSVLLGYGDGNFQTLPAIALPATPGGDVPDALIFGDFNGDGRMDLAVQDSGSNDVVVLYGIGDGTFLTPQVFAPTSPTVAGLFSNSTGSTTGSLFAQELAAHAAAVFVPGDVVASSVQADFNRGGQADLAVLEPATNGVTIAVNLPSNLSLDAATLLTGLAGLPSFATLDSGLETSGTPLATFGGELSGLASNSLLTGQPVGTALGELGTDLQTAASSITDLGVAFGGVATDFSTFGPAVATTGSQLLAVSGNLIAVASLLQGQTLFSVDLSSTANSLANLATSLGETGTGLSNLGNTLGGSSVNIVSFFSDLDQLASGLQDTGAALAGFGSSLHALGTSVATVDFGVFSSVGSALLSGASATSSAGEGVTSAGTTLANAVNGLFGPTSNFIFADDPSEPPALYVKTGAQLPTLTIASDPIAFNLANPESSLTPDLAALSLNGDILIRIAQANQALSYFPPVVINPGEPARDITLVQVGTGIDVAALNFDGSVSLYALAPGTTPGTVTVQSVVSLGPTGFLADRIVAGDLEDDGEQDLVVGSSGDGSLYIFLQDPTAPSGFRALAPISVGLAISDIAIADLTGNGYGDILYTDPVSGEVGVLLNLGLPPGTVGFAPEQLYRADTAPYGAIVSSPGIPTVGGIPTAVSSTVQTNALAVADFSNDGEPDVVTIGTNLANPSASNTFDLLTGEGGGAFVDPTSLQGWQIGSQPIAIAYGDFTHDGNIDLAVLDAATQSISVFLGDGKGNFTLDTNVDGEGHSFISAGDVPTGLSAVDVTGNGNLDLVVSNQYGDALILLGNGDGTFRSFVNADQAVPFVTTNANGDVIVANQSTDQLTSQTRQAGTTNFTAGNLNQQGGGLIAPGAVTLADLTNNGLQDLIIANSGSNNILVYMRQSDGSFAAPQSFFAGTDPVSVTVADINGDGIPDLIVANEGSNDVSILYGQGTMGPGGVVSNWTLTYGPRLDAGKGPLGVTVQFPSGSNNPNLLVSDSDGKILEIPGVGNGLFNDTNPQALNLGSSILQALTNGFVLTQAGIFQVDENTLTATEVFASTTLTTLATFDDDLVVGLADGSIEVLAEQNGHFAESQIFKDAQLTDPSALEVNTINGVPEIYATTAGENTIFIFSLENGDRSQTTTVQPVSDVGVALVATVVTGKGEFVLEEGSDLGFAVGLGETSINVSALATLSTLLIGGSGAAVDPLDPVGLVGPTSGSPSFAPLDGFISGIDDAMRLFQERIAGPDPRGGVADGTPAPVDMRSLVDQAYSGFFESATALGESSPVPAHAGAYSFRALDAAMLALRPTENYSGMEGSELGLQAVLESVQQALRPTGRAVNRYLEGGLLPPNRAPAQQPSGPMSANERDGQQPIAWAPRPLVPDPDGLPTSLTADPFDWQANLAVSLVLGCFWQTGQQEEDRRPGTSR